MTLWSRMRALVIVESRARVPAKARVRPRPPAAAPSPASPEQARIRIDPPPLPEPTPPAPPEQTPAPRQPVPGTALVPLRRAPDRQERARYFGLAAAAPPSVRVAPGGVAHDAPLPLPLRDFATGDGMGAPRLGAVEPIRFSAYLVWPEGASEVPVEAGAAWRTLPALQADGIAVRDALLARGPGAPPIGPAALFDLTLRRTGSADAALLVAHNVAKAFARGGQAIEWQAVQRDGGVFAAGPLRHRPMPDATAPAIPIFYGVFAASAFGTADTGDWYRFYAIAVAALLAASGACAPARMVPEGAALRFARAIERVARALREAVPGDDAAAQAWRWANALSFAEFACWGQSDARARAAAHLGIDGALFGLRLAGARPDPQWRWAVPRAGGWRDGSESGPVPVAEMLAPLDMMVA